MAIDANDLRLLSVAIAQAIQQSGGAQGGPAQRWDPVASRVTGQGTPQERADSIRSDKFLSDNNKLVRELSRLMERNTRSVDDLRKFNAVHEKTMQKAINSYDDIDDSTKALVKQLQKQLASQDATAQKLNKLAGNIEGLQDVLAFGDLTKQLSDLSKSIDSNSEARQEDVVEAIEALEKTLKAKNPNATIGDVSPELKTLSDEIKNLATITRAATAADVAAGNASNVGDRVRDEAKINRRLNDLRNDNRHRNAQEQLRDLALDGSTRGIRANNDVVRRSNSLGAVANKRLMDWTARIATSAFVLDQLASAAKQLYTTYKIAGGTGTEKNLFDFLKRDVKSFVNGVDPNVMQESQVKGARARASFGKENFDKSLLDGVNNLFGVTYDRNDAMRLQEATLSNLLKSGISAENTKNAASSKALRDSFLKLQALTGMTGEQMAALNTEMASDTQFRQGLMTLSEKERAATVVGITKMFEENAQRNISIDQTKSMIKAQLALADAHSPKTRIKNAAKLRAMGGALGVDTNDAADLVLASGNDGLMKKRLLAKGHTEAQADAKVKNARLTQERLGTMAEQDLSGNDARGLMMESLLDKTGTKDYALSAGQTLNVAGKMQKEAADKMMAAAVKMGENATLSGSNMLNTVDFVKNSLGTITGTLIAAAAGAVAMRFGGAQAIRSAAGYITRNGGGAGGGGVVNRIRGMFSNAPTVPNGVVGNAAPRTITPVNGGHLGPVSVNGPAANGGVPGGAAATVRAAPGLGTMGTVGAAGGAAANGAGAAGAAGAVPTAGLGSKAMGVLGKLAIPLSIGLGAWGVGSALSSDGTATEKGAGVGSAVGGTAGGIMGGLKGAALGATLGSAIPIIGTGVGAVAGGLIGGLGGGWAGDKLGGWMGGGVGGLVGQSKTPGSPSISPTVNTPMVNDGAPGSSRSGSNKIAANTTTEPTAEQAAAQAQQVALQRGIDTMNKTLGDILTALQEQTGEVTDGTEKTLSAQQRLQRMLKNTGFAGSTPADGTANMYKAS